MCHFSSHRLDTQVPDYPGMQYILSNNYIAVTSNNVGDSSIKEY